MSRKTKVFAALLCASLWAGVLRGSGPSSRPVPETPDRAGVTGPDHPTPPREVAPTSPATTNPSDSRGFALPPDRLEAGGYYHSAWAVIVGIDPYPGGASHLEPLMFAGNDARAIRDVLRDEFGFPAEHIR